MSGTISTGLLLLALNTTLWALDPSRFGSLSALPLSMAEAAGGRCPYGHGKESLFDGSHGGDHVHLGSFLGDLATPPFELVVHKSTLGEGRTFTVTAESQVSTGYDWLCLDVLAEAEHANVAGRHLEHYKSRLDRDFLEDVARHGKAAHGLSVTPFAVVRDGASLDKLGNAPAGGCHTGVGKKETSKATLTVSKDVEEGKFFVVFAYGSVFRQDSVSSFKEVLVKVLP